MRRKNRSKSDHLDEILDENKIYGDLSEDEIDEILKGFESDDEPDDDSETEVPDEEKDDESDSEISEDESNAGSDEEVSDDGPDKISDEEVSGDGPDEISDEEVSDDGSDDISSEEVSEDDTDEISDEEVSEEELASLLNDEDSEEEPNVDEDDSFIEEDEDEPYIEEYEDEPYEDEEDDEPDQKIDRKSKDLPRRNTDRSEEKSSAGLLLGIVWILFAVLCAVYVYVFYIKKPQDVPGKNNTVKLEIPDGANYRLCDIDEIDRLVSDFLTARANCDQKVLQSLVTDPSQFDDMTGLKMIFTDYARGYQNTTCYIVDGYDENGYFVIELSNLKLVDIKSQPLDVMSFYIVRLGDGSYKIDNSKHTTEVESYISNVTASKDIQDIYIHVKDQNDYLLKTDTAFADLYHRIME